MNKSDSISNLAAALAKAQPKIEGATKDKTNPHFKSKYADLGSVAEAIAGPLAANGLSYVQTSHDREHAAAIETLILHTSGEWLGCGVVAVPVSKLDAQGFGSALTYARRYSLSAAFGVVPEDDDGNQASKAPPRGSAAEVAHDAMGSQGPEEQEFLRKISVDVVALLDENRDDEAAAHLVAQKLDNEEKLAIWSLFNSKQRASLKARKAA